MSKVVVFGNGESRANINIDYFKPDYITVGCNAIHRDVVVDHLICCDQRMVNEAILNPKYDNSLIYVRNVRTVEKSNIRTLPDLPYLGTHRVDKPIHWGSGPYAVLIAALLSPKEIHLYGFDLYSSTNTVNNVYKGTPNYSSKDYHAVDPAYWIQQISKIFFHFPQINFKVHNLVSWKLPNDWKHHNVEILAAT